MSLIKQNMVAYSPTGVDLVLEVPAQYSIRVKDIRLDTPAASATDLIVSVQQKQVLRFVAPVNFFLIKNAPFYYFRSIFGKLNEIGLFSGVPVASGETLTVAGVPATDSVEVVYDLYAAGDIKPEDANGSNSKKYQLFQMISNAGVLAASGNIQLNQSDLPGLYPAFPGGNEVPSDTVMTLRAIFGSPISKGDGAANDYYTERLRLIHNQVDIDSLTRAGRQFTGDFTYTAASIAYRTVFGALRMPVANTDGLVDIIDPPMVFNPGDELTCSMDIVVAGPGVLAGELKLGFLFDVEHK